MYKLTMILVVMLCLVSAALARDRPFVDEADPSLRDDLPETPEWTEGRYTLPAYPNDEDLVEFSVDTPSSPFRYFLDEKSVSIGEDETVRYTVVIRSPSGGNNVSYEGIRCNERAFKIYAYGSGRGKFNALPGAEWTPIFGNTAEQYHKDLREFYFCIPNRHVPYSREEILRNLSTKRGRSSDLGLF